MKVSITFSDLEVDEAEKLLKAAETEEVETPAPRKSRKSKDEEPEEIEEEEEETAEEEEETDGPTLADVMAACKLFVKRNGGDKKTIIPILKKFKVKTPNELEEDDYASVLKLLLKK